MRTTVVVGESCCTIGGRHAGLHFGTPPSAVMHEVSRVSPKLGADTVAPVGTSSRLDSCAAHADGGVLIAGAELISLSPGAPPSRRANPRHVRVAPMAGGYAIYADASHTAGDLELVDRTLSTTGRVSLPVQELYDPSAVTSDGTNALVLRVHHATVTVTRVDAVGTTLGTTVLKLDAYVPPAVK